MKILGFQDEMKNTFQNNEPEFYFRFSNQAYKYFHFQHNLIRKIVYQRKDLIKNTKNIYLQENKKLIADV